MGLRDIADKVRGKSSGSKTIEESDSVSRSSSSPSGRVDMDDFHSLVMALGEMQMYSHVLKKELEDDGSKKGKIAAETASDVSGNTVEFIGTFEVPDIAKRHGVDWESDVLERISSGDVDR